jgi:hypothetical protein
MGIASRGNSFPPHRDQETLLPLQPGLVRPVGKAIELVEKRLEALVRQPAKARLDDGFAGSAAGFTPVVAAGIKVGKERTYSVEVNEVVCAPQRMFRPSIATVNSALKSIDEATVK